VGVGCHSTVWGVTSCEYDTVTTVRGVTRVERGRWGYAYATKKRTELLLTERRELWTVENRVSYRQPPRGA
jgi:hypothetical protein